MIGAGLIGLSVARALARNGRRSVTVLDAHPDGMKSSWAAAGMLSPLGETGGHPDLLNLGRRSRDLYPGWISALEAEGFDVPFRVSGRLDPAASPEEARRLEDEVRHWRHLGEDVAWLTPDEVASREPALGRPPAAAWFPRDAWVDPRALLSALRDSVLRVGVEIRPDAAVAVSSGSASDLRVRTRTGAALTAEFVVVAAGAWSGLIEGVVGPQVVVPVRGDMLALTAARGPAVMLHTPDVYVVPRDDRILIGASMMREGFDHSPRPAVIEGLRKAAERLCPGLSAADEVERWAGVRPGSRDGLPLLGRDPEEPRLIHATGHFRNGVLLAPVTAECVEAEVDDRPPPLRLDAFAPGRFTRSDPSD